MQPLLPGPGYDAPPEFAFSAWEPVGRDSVSLIWGQGMGGISMQLAVRGDTLQGRAYAVTDVRGPEPDPEAPAAALRVSCAPWKPGEVDMRVDAVLIRLLRREPA
ncbi:MAG: hypothetical protein M3P51_14800 [Chloroflexota bacterium]|nr:hypothetical protein [Chloroflexota bacterium]